MSDLSALKGTTLIIFDQLAGGVGEDIHEGKRTLMVLHAFKNAVTEVCLFRRTLKMQEASRLREILGMHTNDVTLIK